MNFKILETEKTTNMLRPKEEIKAQLELLYRFYDIGFPLIQMGKSIEELIKSRKVDVYLMDRDHLKEQTDFIIRAFISMHNRVYHETKLLGAAPRAQARHKTSLILNEIDELTDQLYSKFEKLEA